MADLEERTRTFLKTTPEEDDLINSGGNTFAERAEWFFKKRPELLNLLRELFSAYISLKQHKLQTRHSSPLTLPFDQQQQQQQQEEQEIDTYWDIESSLSNQTPDFDNELASRTALVISTGSWINNSPCFQSSRTGSEELVSQLVIKNVEEGILRAQMGEMENQFQECWRKTEIMKKLIEVLESERVILLSDNSRLGCKVGELMEENKGLVEEVVFLKREGAELGRCVMEMREDLTACMVTRKIEDLQTQINGLLDQRKQRVSRNYSMGTRKLMIFKKRNGENGVEGKRGRKWWDKVRKGINFLGFG